jgi:hypothetical protein
MSSEIIYFSLHDLTKRIMHCLGKNSLFSSPRDLRVNKSRIIWEGACYPYRENRNMYKVLEWKPNGKYHFEELGLHDSIILKWILDI